MNLSIVVPVYNVELYLRDCLDSLVAQPLDPTQYEILCIDDGSTDGSGSILDEYADRYPQVHVVHQENAGVSTARNSGIELAKGDYIWFVDSDDFIARDVLPTIINALRSEAPDMLMVKPIRFEDGTDIAPYKNGQITADKTSEQYHDWLWTRLIKRSAILESKVRFHPQVSLAEDHLFCTMLNPFISRIITLDLVVYCYRFRTNSLTSTSTENKMDKLINSAQIFLEHGQKGIIKTDVAMIMVCSFVVPIMAHIAQLPRKQADKILVELKSKQLFPLKKQKCYRPNLSYQNLSFRNRLLLRLKHISYTGMGYRLLRSFRFVLRVQRKLSLKKGG